MNQLILKAVALEDSLLRSRGGGGGSCIQNSRPGFDVALMDWLAAATRTVVVCGAFPPGCCSVWESYLGNFLECHFVGCMKLFSFRPG